MSLLALTILISLQSDPAEFLHQLNIKFRRPDIRILFRREKCRSKVDAEARILARVYFIC